MALPQFFGKWVWNGKAGEWKEYERIALQKEMNVLQKRWPLDKSAGNSVLMHELKEMKIVIFGIFNRKINV